tara:strand:- start:94 stop:504 length:411 start_codon:yes stop_codon:yes gene_type:complete
MTWVDNKDFKHQRDIQNERNSMKKPKLPSLTKKQFNLLEQLKLLREGNHSNASFSHNSLRQTIRSLYKRGLIFAEGRVPNPKVICDPDESMVTHFTNVNITSRGLLLLNAYKHKMDKSEHLEYWATKYSNATKEVV